MAAAILIKHVSQLGCTRGPMASLMTHTCNELVDLIFEDFLGLSRIEGNPDLGFSFLEVVM